MAIKPLIQPDLFDVRDWEPDAEFAVYPQGARAKDAVFAPELVPSDVLVPGKRYLFKRSKRSYPDQFWGEIVAYRVGCLMGVPVPPAFAAVHSIKGYCGALIEWFYVSPQTWVQAGDFLQQIRPDFERRTGSTHNLEDIRKLMTALSQAPTLDFAQDWRRWWVDGLLFDALIGNTDRHQDNWGLVFTVLETPIARLSCEMGPYFDNGTSLGHEHFAERVQGWSDERLATYVSRGTHHVRWSLTGDIIKGHQALVEKVLTAWPDTVPHARSRLEFSSDQFDAYLDDLQGIPASPKLSDGRMEFVKRLLHHRLNLLKNLVDGHA